MNWDEYFLNIACEAGLKSSCLSRKIGAVLVADKKFIVGTGYNGPPISVSPCSQFSVWQHRFNQVGLPEGLLTPFTNGLREPLTKCPRQMLGYKSGEGLHMCPAAHAERNAIDIAARIGRSTNNCYLYLTCGIPCLECAKTVIQAGIQEIIVPHKTVYEKQPITGEQLLREAKIKIRLYDCDSAAILKAKGY